MKDFKVVRVSGVLEGTKILGQLPWRSVPAWGKVLRVGVKAW